MGRDAAVERWLETRAPDLLRRAGVQRGQCVLDFGCNRGNYALAAARAVGPAGMVVAVDKDQDVLKELRQAKTRQHLGNVQLVRVAPGERVPVRDASVDVALLYDVYHRGYAPEREQRDAVTRGLRRVLKPGGLLSLYATHLRQFGMTMAAVLAEFRAAGFVPLEVHRRRLVHDGKLVRGRVMSLIAP